jgi:hypothetical protein
MSTANTPSDSMLSRSGVALCNTLTLFPDVAVEQGIGKGWLKRD